MMVINPLTKRGINCMMAFSVSVMVSLTTVSGVSGRPFRIAKTPDRGRNFGCATCHVSSKGGGGLNSFGRDYERFAIEAGDKYTDHLGGLDSDGDGFKNDEEFAAGTHPGDANSKLAEPEGRKDENKKEATHSR